MDKTNNGMCLLSLSKGPMINGGLKLSLKKTWLEKQLE